MHPKYCRNRVSYYYTELRAVGLSIDEELAYPDIPASGALHMSLVDSTDSCIVRGERAKDELSEPRPLIHA